MSELLIVKINRNWGFFNFLNKKVGRAKKSHGDFWEKRQNRRGNLKEPGRKKGEDSIIKSFSLWWKVEVRELLLYRCQLH